MVLTKQAVNLVSPDMEPEFTVLTTACSDPRWFLLLWCSASSVPNSQAVYCCKTTNQVKSDVWLLLLFFLLRVLSERQSLQAGSSLTIIEDLTACSLKKTLPPSSGHNTFSSSRGMSSSFAPFRTLRHRTVLPGRTRRKVRVYDHRRSINILYTHKNLFNEKHFIMQSK